MLSTTTSHAVAATFKVIVLVGLAHTGFGDTRSANESIENRQAESWQMARKIFDWAEVGYQEHQSSSLIADRLEQAGFRVDRGVANIPTAFVASYGAEGPVIAILGEYDALPGSSQVAEPIRAPVEGNLNGHACGHHLFGVASMSAAIAVAEQIDAGHVVGQVRFYGCPAEEGGSGKAFMVRDGLFDGCDVALHWHPSDSNAAGDPTCLSRIAVKFRYRGRSSHAAAAPEQGRSALDAVELSNHAAQLLREHTPDLTRIHHVITAGGDAPNVVPDRCEVYYYIRHPNSDVVRELYPRLVNCAKAGALATETELEIEYQGGTVELLPNDVLAEISLKNLRDLTDLQYDDEQLRFAARVQATLPKPKPLSGIATVINTHGQTVRGSTDVGDVSWVVPTSGFKTACWVPGTEGHSWQAVAAGGTSIGRDGMQLAAKVLAANAIDLLKNPELIAAAKAEHRKRLSGRGYEPLIGDEQSPPLDYRN